MTIGNRLLRRALSALAAGLGSAAVFLLIGCFLPVWLIELAYGPWEDLPIGAGFLLMCVALPVGLISLLTLPFTTGRIYRVWSPVSSTD